MYKQSTWHFNRYVPKYNYRPDPTFGAIMNVGASGIHIGMKIKQRTYKPTIKPMYQIRSQIHQKPKMEFSGDAKMTKVIGKLGVNKRASGGFKRQYLMIYEFEYVLVYVYYLLIFLHQLFYIFSVNYIVF